ncbi:hypothetical protein F66182_3941 [Fusarium sp. NRRL 66182]|nr:hypothetical protein F66182_3941 [Fusarium sp. NRRL 66182]
MVSSKLLVVSLGFASLSLGQCPFAAPGRLSARDEQGSREHLKDHEIDDSEGYMSSDVGGPFEEQESLKAGERGPTLLEDFIFRQKITHFDHERACYPLRPESSFLSSKGKKTPTFVRFSTVAGSRGSADTVRDVHGFATRFYTDEGILDIVGNNIPVFFIQDAIQFPDLIHAVKPSPDSEIPQAASAHDSAWDFFSQQTSTMHTLFWAMSGNGIPRSYRHMDGFGVHTFRLVTDDGDTKFVKWHWKTKQGKASLVWDEAQHLAGKNADFHRADLWDAIESGNGPEWELNVQIFDEEQALAFGFDVLDATKIIPEEYVPLQPIGLLKLDANPTNYFAETEQIMFQPGHIVRGIDFTNDPLLQGRIFSYLDTQLNRHGGPNFEQLPINRPISPIHNNNRDGAAQMFIHKNTAPYTPNTLNNGYPAQANQTQGRGFFTAPGRTASGNLMRARASTFADHWSQPRLFYNSLTKAERQFLINAIRFEMSNLKSEDVKKNVLYQLNRISHDIAVRVARALGLEAPEADSTYYHDNTTAGISIFGTKLPTIATLTVGVLASANSQSSIQQAKAIKEALAESNVTVSIVGEVLGDDVGVAYNAAEAAQFDGIIVASGAESLFNGTSRSTLFPPGRPAQIVVDGYHWGKPVGFVGSARTAAQVARIGNGDGVYLSNDVDDLVGSLKEGLATFKFTERFPVDE